MAVITDLNAKAEESASAGKALNIQLRQAALSYAVPTFANLNSLARESSKDFIQHATAIETYLKGSDL
jgi:hypothetical protein